MKKSYITAALCEDITGLKPNQFNSIALNLCNPTEESVGTAIEQLKEIDNPFAIAAKHKLEHALGTKRVRIF